jgi:hypothetical protein
MRVPNLLLIAILDFLLLPSPRTLGFIQLQVPRVPAAQKQAAPPNERKRNPDVRALLDVVSTIPPEIAADALLQLVESGGTLERSSKIDLIVRAFELAKLAQNPVKERLGTPGVSTDTQAQSREMAFRLNLDRLSLQSRSVKAMLAVDRRKARALFEGMDFPELVPLGCEHVLVYDPTPFYQTLGKVVSEGFTGEEKRKGQHIQLLERYVLHLQSHTQVAPVADLLRNLDLSPAEFEEVNNGFITSLPRLDGDKRSFAYAVRNYKFDSIVRLAKQLEKRGVSSESLLMTVREYLVSNFREAPCSDIMHDSAGAKSLFQAVDQLFNRLNEGLKSTPPAASAFAPIRQSEVEDVLDPSQARDRAYWQSPKAKELFDGVRALRFGKGRQRLTISERETVAWRVQLSDLLKKVDSWMPGDEPEEDFFHEKAIIYTGLIDLTPPGPERTRIVFTYVDFLDRAYSQRRSAVEWLWHVNDLVNRIATDDRGEILQAFADSRNPTLNVYARLQRLKNVS